MTLHSSFVAALALSLFAWERGLHRSTGWLALSAAALVSIPLSGQVHLALGAIPFLNGPVEVLSQQQEGRQVRWITRGTLTASRAVSETACLFIA